MVTIRRVEKSYVVVFLALVLLPVTAMAFSGGIGTEFNPYKISTPNDLLELADNVNNGNNYEGVYFQMINSIAIPEDHNTADGGWVPIGSCSVNNNSAPFSGVFDGNEHVIRGVKINRDVNCQGLFGYIKNGGVKNLGVENVEVKATSYCGGLVGNLDTSYDDNGDTIVRGTSIVKSCYVTGSVTGDSVVGGIAGSVADGGIISECYTTAKVGFGSQIGGIAGSMLGILSDSYSTGNVSGTEMVGGIVGYMYWFHSPYYTPSTSLTNCYATGIVSGSRSVGGIIGHAGPVRNCVALNPSVTGDSSNDSGRIWGSSLDMGFTFGNYALDTMMVNGALITDDANKGLDHMNGADASGTGALTAAFWSNSPPGFDLAIWEIGDGSYPKLIRKSCQGTFSIAPSSIRFPSGGGSQSVTINANNSSCSWSAFELLDWVRLVKTSGTGGDSLQIIAEENTGKGRSGMISIAGQELDISQGPNNSILSLIIPTVILSDSSH